MKYWGTNSKSYACELKDPYSERLREGTSVFIPTKRIQIQILMWWASKSEPSQFSTLCSFGLAVRMKVNEWISQSKDKSTQVLQVVWHGDLIILLVFLLPFFLFFWRGIPRSFSKQFLPSCFTSQEVWWLDVPTL